VTFDAVKVGVLVFVAAVLQTAVFSGVVVLGGTPDVLLVTLVAVALLRGPLVGAFAGFLGGLVVDVAMLETLGMTSLLLTLVGYWTGRYGEQVGVERRYVPYVSVAAMTFLYLVGLLVVRFLLAEPAPVQTVLLETLFQSLVLNVLLMWPVFHLVQRLLPAREPKSLSSGVGVLG
jgi:rod shape-determining protein MreD